jgi:hypothetical protein
VLASDDASNFLNQLESVDIMVRRVGFKINRAKTEYMMVGNRTSRIELPVSTCTISLVEDFTLAAKLRERFWDQKGISLEGLYWISQNLEEQLLELVLNRFF